jgi:hypothetical protein
MIGHEAVRKNRKLIFICASPNLRSYGIHVGVVDEEARAPVRGKTQ